MAGPLQPNHRRDRHETRRILAAVCVQYRDLTKSISFGEIDLLDQQRMAANDNCKVVVSAESERT